MFQAHPQQQQQQYQSPVKPSDSCYKCHKPGHWARSCPENPNNRSPTPQPINSDQEFPATHCICGAGHCLIKISKSFKNPNKKYYSCPGKMGMNCGYFNWCDKLVEEGNVRVVRPKPYPVCGCGAGVCTLVNADPSYFVCPIKKGDGACNFRQWLDNSPETISITSSNPVATLDDFDFSDEVVMQLDAIEIPAHVTPIEEDRFHVEGEEEDIQDETYGLPMETPEDHPRLVANNVSEIPDSEMIILSDDSLNNQLHTLQMGKMQASHTKAVAALNKGVLEGSQPRFGILPNPPSPLKDNLHEGNIMTSTTQEAFGNFARQFQNKLIELLESTNPHDHETMTKEANAAFSALERLQVDYRPLYSRVMEYIKRASSLAHIEQITNVEELVTHRDNEQRRFDKLQKSHQEVLDAFTASYHRFTLLCAKASLFDSSLELAEELSSCEAEIADRQEALRTITKTIVECKESLHDASQKAEEALKVSEKMEMEWSEAESAFQTARAQLRD
ncbi:hypothetical protein KSS87_018755 [Heliosperma pusillum]|nr:hypothetical protein KSS87_018755 [Heliosperma pusillum]